ncbi:hypothetical protein OEJ84_23080 (plasmid) [Bacillus subtilis]|nr:hypothetical protein [Bacillus subtilis]YP_010681701.1 hypothetical protein PQE76_gp083 [Bacillus phage vB_BsuS_PJN02]UNH58426.1 hypothetical protein [Bacillus phage vB_BsuS_PJN02]WOF33012.1 hypothetical protein OEJ84_23080 [Bacillus subtilis]
MIRMTKDIIILHDRHPSDLATAILRTMQSYETDGYTCEVKYSFDDYIHSALIHVYEE